MNVLSLFDGMSCGRIALQRAGVEVDCYLASEIDKYAIKVAQANYPDTIQLGCVTDVEADFLPEIDLLIGGSPCQGFSFAGKQLNFEDPRSKLFFEFVRLLKECKPKYFLLENVKMKKESEAVITELLGVEPIEINSALVSAQNRRRLYWTNIPGVEQPEDRGVLLRDILEKDPENVTFMSSTFVERQKGRGCLRDDFEGKAKCLSAMEYVKNGRQGDYVKCGQVVGRKINNLTGKREDNNPKIKAVQRVELRGDGKTNCLTTVQKDNVVVVRDKSKCVRSSGRGSYYRHEWDSISDCHYRKLTPVECERLQTVPDNYTNHVSNTQRYKMLGNGWTVGVVAHIFKGLKS
jgi:DNA-cytosine methyltransferase